VIQNNNQVVSLKVGCGICGKKKCKCKKKKKVRRFIKAAKAQIFQEKICGNFGPGATLEVWTNSVSDYIQGTFEVFNSSSSDGEVTGKVASASLEGLTSTPITAPPGWTVGTSVKHPKTFTIATSSASNGTYCITLYKHVKS